MNAHMTYVYAESKSNCHFWSVNLLNLRNCRTAARSLEQALNNVPRSKLDFFVVDMLCHFT